VSSNTVNFNVFLEIGVIISLAILRASTVCRSEGVEYSSLPFGLSRRATLVPQASVSTSI